MMYGINKITTRYFSPKKQKEISEKRLKYKNAEQLAKDINFNDNERYFVIVDGTFYFGDFIEAFIVNYNIHVKKMTISTLSMNQNNIDSLSNLINGGYIDELNLIVSDYFYSHEKNKLIKYAYQKLDINNKFQLASCSSHCKICIFESFNKRYYNFHGSANLRSSSNIEQLCLEESKELYHFLDDTHDKILKEYKTINKSIRNNKLWQTVVMEKEKEVQDQKEQERNLEPHLEQSVKQKQEHHFKF